jgi:myo-inositol-1(or 4)-monophosphatase
VLAAKTAGLILKEGFGKPRQIDYKGAINLVTEMDRRSEAVIIEILSREFPDCGILAEESAEQKGRGTGRWIIDPLDGTTNYAHGYPFFCVSIAFEDNGAVVWGAVYDPLRDELFLAEAGGGATLNGTPLAVSKADDLGSAFLSTGFPYDVRESAEDNVLHFSRFAKRSRAIRRDGSAALDLCYVAMGRFDGFWEPKLHPWDTAAGSLIVIEAGGRVTEYNGSPFFLDSRDILATNGLIHGAMIDVLSRDSFQQWKTD